MGRDYVSVDSVISAYRVWVLLLVVTVVGGAVAGASAFSAPRAGRAAAGPALIVSASGPGAHPIDPDIYGANAVSAGFGRRIGVPVDRWGGNATEAYNYLIGATNAGSDWYFENVSDCWNPTYNWCSGDRTNPIRAYRLQIQEDRRLGATTLLTLPMAGYVARDAPVAQPLTCGFPVSAYPHQNAFDAYDKGCGDGKDGARQLEGRPLLDAIPIDAAWDGGWVRSLVRGYGTAARGGVGIYQLGNEPSLWGVTHADIHPRPESASELWRKSRALATAVKQADPTARVLGFSEWGWTGYFCSESDTYGNGCGPAGCTTSPDCRNHGHLPMAEWYLRQFARYDAATHVRHLDYFDVHYYEAGGNSPEITRSLWDPTYTDPSWIGQPIALIPRLKCWIDGHIPGLCPDTPGFYPATKIAISEYNLSMSSASARTNAIVQGDTLGIFAREGVSLATRWPMSYDGNEIDDAFLMYRNYDGRGSRFGSSYIDSRSADQSRISVYGARRPNDGAFTIMVVNKTTGALASPMKLAGGITGTVSAWQWDGGAITRLSPAPGIRAGAIDATYPPLSMTLLVISSAHPTTRGLQSEGRLIKAPLRSRST